MKPNTTNLFRSLFQKILILLFLLCLTSCAHNISDQSKWQTFDLPPNGWTIKAPEGSYIMRLDPNMDTAPGTLHCDGFMLRFASVTSRENSGCTSDSRYADFQRLIAKGGDTVYYGKLAPHYTYIDTVDNNVALMVAPVGATGGDVMMSTTVCSTKAWIVINGRNLTVDQIRLVQMMFKTVRYTGEPDNEQQEGIERCLFAMRMPSVESSFNCLFVL